MTRHTIVLLTIIALGSTAVLLAANGTMLNKHHGAQEVHSLVFHNQPPTEPLSPTLDPAQFSDKPAAFVAYALAAKIKTKLYQTPCYCPCNREAGHESLLDCFVGRHGVSCHICQKEAIFCFVQSRKGKSPARIREEMANGALRTFDEAKYIPRFYAEIQHHH